MGIFSNHHAILEGSAGTYYAFNPKLPGKGKNITLLSVMTY
jgi:hypothetical protein